MRSKTVIDGKTRYEAAYLYSASRNTKGTPLLEWERILSLLFVCPPVLLLASEIDIGHRAVTRSWVKSNVSDWSTLDDPATSDPYVKGQKLIGFTALPTRRRLVPEADTFLLRLWSLFAKLLLLSIGSRALIVKMYHCNDPNDVSPRPHVFLTYFPLFASCPSRIPINSLRYMTMDSRHVVFRYHRTGEIRSFPGIWLVILGNKVIFELPITRNILGNILPIVLNHTD